MRNQEEGQKRRKLHFLTPKAILGLIVAAVLVVLAIGVGKSFFTKSTTIKIGFEDIGEFATQSAYCKEINMIENARDLWGVTIPFTQSKYIYSYGVTIKAGFDFKEIEWSADEKNHVIEVKLPEARVLSNEIDLNSFEVYHEAESIFQRITLDNSNEALKDLKQKAEQDSIENGLLTNARSNAETLLKGFFAGKYDMTQYQIKFTDK